MMPPDKDLFFKFMTAPEVNILIVDDDQDDFIITSEYMRHIPNTNFSIAWCPRYQDALAHMIRKDFDLYFVDYRLGAKSGMDLLKEALANDCEEPVILLTGKGNYEVDIEAMQLGAVDYLVKTELTQEKIERSIRYTLDRTATMKALRSNERKYRSIFEKSKDIVFITDETLAFLDVNETASILLKYDKEEILSMNLTDFLEQPQDKDHIRNVIQTRKEINDWEVTIHTKDGARKSCILTATYEHNYTNPGYIHGIIHDITSLRKAEKATLQAEKLAAAGRLVRTLAHEVRNPLNNITLSVEQLLEEEENEEAAFYLRMIQRNSKRINDLVSELLNTSRPTEIQLAEHVLQQLLDEVIASAMDRLTLKRIGLTLNYPETPLRISADGEKLKIALLNVVINAIEAMEENAGMLKVDLDATPAQAVLRISDNGIGISEENISRLFEPYFTQKRNGVGLGLAFTLNIIQAHGGSIEVSSVDGGGTSFIITFPLASSIDS